MKILILGATGRTGGRIATLADNSGHKVTAIVRNLQKATLPFVEYVESAPVDGALLTRTLAGIDAVVVSLNINRVSDNPWAKVASPLTLISDTVRALIPAMEQNGVKRIVTISASGVGDSWNDMPLPGKLFIRCSNIWKAYLDHGRQETILRSSQLDWTIARPVMLNDKPSENYRTATGKALSPSIPRNAVAKFVVDTLEQRTHIREIVALFE